MNLHASGSRRGAATLLGIVFIIVLGLVGIIVALIEQPTKPPVAVNAFCPHDISRHVLPRIEERLTDRIGQLNLRGESIEALPEWLQTQPCVASAAFGREIIKTSPPERELFIAFRTANGGMLEQVVDIVILPNNYVAFGRIHEPGAHPALPSPNLEPSPALSPTPPSPAPTPQTDACRTDADCKIIYSSCGCEAVPVSDPRTELPSTIMCLQNNCTNSQQTARAVCENNRCAVRREQTVERQEPDRPHEDERYIFTLYGKGIVSNGIPIPFQIDRFAPGSTQPLVLPNPIPARVTLRYPNGTTLTKNVELVNSTMYPPCAPPPPDYKGEYCRPVTNFTGIPFSFEGFTAARDGLTFVWRVSETERNARDVYALSAVTEGGNGAVRPFYFRRESLPETFFVVNERTGQYEARTQPYVGETFATFSAHYGTHAAEVTIASAPIDPRKILDSAVVNEVSESETVYHRLYYGGLLGENRKERIDGNLVLRSLSELAFAWPSGRFFIRIHWFNNQFSYGESERTFVAEYLRKYPSSLR